jgi:hypothetical protein
MRDIIDTLELISESTGLAGRRTGDVFRNEAGDEIIFDNIIFVPEKGGRLEGKDLDDALLSVDDSVQWMNSRTGRMGGYAIATFNSPDGPLYFGRYLENVKANFVSNYVPNQVAGYKLASKTALKAQAGLTPQELLTEKTDLSANDIVVQLATSLGTSNPLYSVAYKLAMGEPLPMTFAAPSGISFSAFRDYFCEILQPIALQRGQYTGNAGEAAEIFLGGGFDDTLISFDFSKTAGLSDSTMSNEDGKYIKVSSKGGTGATASTKNLINSVNELSHTPDGKKLLDSHPEVIEILREMTALGQVGAPLGLGVRFDIIDDEDAAQIRDLKDTPPVRADKIDDLGLSDNLVRLAKSRKPDNPERISLYFHLIAAIAHRVAKEVNETTGFSAAAADILNNGALVQVYTKAKEGKETWTLYEFDTVYPGNSIRGVYLSASKTYYSTGIKGNFTFKIDRGKGLPEDNQPGEMRTKRIPTDKELEKKAADIVLGRENPKEKITSRMGNVGRSLRK